MTLNFVYISIWFYVELYFNLYLYYNLYYMFQFSLNELKFSRQNMNITTDISNLPKLTNFTISSIYRLLLPNINLIRSNLKSNTTLTSMNHIVFGYYIYIIITYLSWQCIYICYTISFLLNSTHVRCSMEHRVYNKSDIHFDLTIDLNTLELRIWIYSQRHGSNKLQIFVHYYNPYIRVCFEAMRNAISVSLFFFFTQLEN